MNHYTKLSSLTFIKEKKTSCDTNTQIKGSDNLTIYLFIFILEKYLMLLSLIVSFFIELFV